MATSRKKLLINTVSVSLGCSSCRKPKLAFLFHPKSRPKKPTYHKHSLFNNNSSSSSSSSHNTNLTHYDTASATTFSPNMDTTPPHHHDHWGTEPDYTSSRPVRGFGRVGGESVAVEKDSDDPYLDFRQSMLQMILEKEIYSKEDLKELLNCFLQLNSPYHHEIIVRAFSEIWNGVFSVKSGMAAASSKLRFGCKSRDF